MWKIISCCSLERRFYSSFIFYCDQTSLIATAKLSHLDFFLLVASLSRTCRRSLAICLQSLIRVSSSGGVPGVVRWILLLKLIRSDVTYGDLLLPVVASGGGRGRGRGGAGGGGARGGAGGRAT